MKLHEKKKMKEVHGVIAEDDGVPHLDKKLVDIRMKVERIFQSTHTSN